MNDNRLIHVVGMYKSGTSWLTHMLSSHHQIAGWMEFDAIGMAFREKHWEALQDPSVMQRLHAWIRGSDALTFQSDPDVGMEPLDSDTIFRNYFAGQGWMPLMGEKNRELACDIDATNVESFLDEFLNLAQMKLERKESKLLNPSALFAPLGYQNTTKSSLLELMRIIKDAENPYRVVTAFYGYLQSQVPEETFTAVKAANQIQRLPILQTIAPHSKKIAIVRDARDVAISAGKFQQLMAHVDAPWKESNENFRKRLVGWSRRVRLLLKYQRDYGVEIMRYEDLKADFSMTAGRLFESIGVEVNDVILERIKQKTQFEAVSGGRKPGEEAFHRIRKGMVGEWRSTFSEDDAEEAWALVGAELRYLGYTKTGSIKRPPKSFIAA